MKQLRKKLRQRFIVWVLAMALMGQGQVVFAQPRPNTPPLPPAGVPGLPTVQKKPTTSLYGGGGPTNASTVVRTATGEKLISLNFREAPLDQVTEFYASLVGRTVIKSPTINASVTLRGQTRLTQQEALDAIESALAMQGVALVPMGTKFLKIVQISSVTQDGIKIADKIPESGLPNTDKLVSQLVELKHISVGDAQPVLQQIMHSYGKIQPLERINTLLITDTATNIKRVMEILEFIDRPEVTRVETRVYEVRHSEATKLAAMLNQLMQEAQADAQKTRMTAHLSPAQQQLQLGRPQQQRAELAQSAQELAERGIVQGKVKILADDRTNILIIISEPSNFLFFDKIVKVLDRPVDPEILMRVVPLEYAEAEQIAGVLNEFIGAASQKDKKGVASGNGGGEGDGGKSQSLQNYAENKPATTTPVRELTTEDKAKIGRLSSATKILSDKRTNALLLMGRRADVAALMEVIGDLDVMQAQVIIEAVILEIRLSDTFEYGIDWLQRSLTFYKQGKQGPYGGVNVRQPLMSFAGGMAGDMPFQDASQLTARNVPLSSGSLTYYATLVDFNIDAIIRLAATTTRMNILATPVIMTTDNKQAKITIAEQRPLVTSTTTSSSTDNQTSHYEYKDIGIEVDVTPHINPQRYVVMEVKQTANHVGGSQRIDNNNVPIIVKRQMEAYVAVENRSTIVLGGLISTDKSLSRRKVPFIGDIPILGALFRSDIKENQRTELLVLLTPYVLMTPDEARRESSRLKSASRAGDEPWPAEWSRSPLSTPSDEEKAKKKKEQERQQQLEEEAINEERRELKEGLSPDATDDSIPDDTPVFFQTHTPTKTAATVPVGRPVIQPDEKSMPTPAPVGSSGASTAGRGAVRTVSVKVGNEDDSDNTPQFN